jgi:hypothetical protein
MSGGKHSTRTLSFGPKPDEIQKTILAKKKYIINLQLLAGEKLRNAPHFFLW